MDDVVQRARDQQVGRILTVATSARSSHNSVELAQQYPEVCAAVGVHPNYAHEATDSDWDQVLGLVDLGEVVALGETGLDKHWDFCPWDVQVLWFERHVALSRETGLPFVVHMRDCEAEMADFLARQAKDGPLNGIMHSFSGSVEMARQCLGWGMHVSFAGMLTYKKNEALRATAAEIPIDRLLIETDSPYLSPHPVRGQRPNEPALVVHTARCLADVRGMGFEEICQATTDNARRLFNC